MRELPICAVIGLLFAGSAAKGGACDFVARLSGEDNRTALRIGALMNSRG
jgi:Kef-type K+ transport system membrane component KefB